MAVFLSFRNNWVYYLHIYKFIFLVNISAQSHKSSYTTSPFYASPNSALSSTQSILHTVQTNLVWWVSGYVGFLVFWVKFLKPKTVSYHLLLNKSAYVGSGYVGKSGYMGEEFVNISKNDLAMWVKGQGQCRFSSLCMHIF